MGSVNPYKPTKWSVKLIMEHFWQRQCDCLKTMQELENGVNRCKFICHIGDFYKSHPCTDVTSAKTLLKESNVSCWRVRALHSLKGTSTFYMFPNGMRRCVIESWEYAAFLTEVFTALDYPFCGDKRWNVMIHHVLVQKLVYKIMWVGISFFPHWLRWHWYIPSCFWAKMIMIVFSCRKLVASFV